LKLNSETGWHWDNSLPSDEMERNKCLEELISRHQTSTYVRSSQLSLDVLKQIPRNEISLWIHPDISKTKLHKNIRDLL
jgi:hypothetical protein